MDEQTTPPSNDFSMIFCILHAQLAGEVHGLRKNAPLYVAIFARYSQDYNRNFTASPASAEHRGPRWTQSEWSQSGLRRVTAVEGALKDFVHRDLQLQRGIYLRHEASGTNIPGLGEAARFPCRELTVQTNRTSSAEISLISTVLEHHKTFANWPGTLVRVLAPFLKSTRSLRVVLAWQKKKKNAEKSKRKLMVNVERNVSASATPLYQLQSSQRLQLWRAAASSAGPLAGGARTTSSGSKLSAS